MALGNDFAEHMAKEHGEPILKCSRNGCDYRTNEMMRFKRHRWALEQKEQVQMVRSDFCLFVFFSKIILFDGLSEWAFFTPKIGSTL